jgi:hypothetical protein
MSNKTKIKTMIRQIVREEVAMAIQEVITELKKPIQQVSNPKPKEKVVEGRRTYKKFTKNSVLNDVLNETAQSDEWKTLGGGTYDSNRVNEVATPSYKDLMNDNNEINPDNMVASMGTNPERVPNHLKKALSKDYSKVLKVTQEKSMAKRIN